MTLQLLGSKITGITANRKPDFDGRLELKTNIKIESLDDFKSTASEIKSVKVSALYEISYGEAGEVSIQGQLFIGGTEEELEKVKSDFAANNFESDFMIGIMNVVLQKFAIKAFTLEEEVGLPIHIKLPSVKVAKKE
ncbi:MAG: hypothetical protein ACI83O_000081 [Patescibacteria group bacterium]|jgi:hypothetical protein